MRALVLALLLSATPAVANDVFHRSHEAGVQVYRGIPAEPDFARIAAIQTEQRRAADAAEKARIAEERLALQARQTEALETLADNIGNLARPQPVFSAPYSAGVFFDGPYSRFPIIQPRPFVRPGFRRRGIRGLPRH